MSLVRQRGAHQNGAKKVTVHELMPGPALSLPRLRRRLL